MYLPPVNAGIFKTVQTWLRASNFCLCSNISTKRPTASKTEFLRVTVGGLREMPTLSAGKSAALELL